MVSMLKDHISLDIQTALPFCSLIINAFHTPFIRSIYLIASFIRFKSPSDFLKVP